MRTYLICLIVLLGLAFQPSVVAACTPDFSPNYWFEESYDFDPALLPEGMHLKLYPDRHEYLQTTYQITAQPREGTLIIDATDDPANKLRHDKLVALYEAGGVESADVLAVYGVAVDASTQEKYGIPFTRHEQYPLFMPSAHIAATEERNPQAVGGITVEPPSPYTTEIWFADQTTLYRLPITVTYSINPNYRPSVLGVGGSLRDAALGAKEIVVATALEVPEYSLDQQLIDAADFEVETWLKGNGDAQIRIAGFGLCEPSVPQGKKIFFIHETWGENLSQFAMFDATDETINAIIDLVGQEPYSPKGQPATQTVAELIETVVQSPGELSTSINNQLAESESPLQPFELVVGLGFVITLVLCLLVFVLWQAVFKAQR